MNINSYIIKHICKFTQCYGQKTEIFKAVLMVFKWEKGGTNVLFGKNNIFKKNVTIISQQAHIGRSK
jgi:hypothetical protein